MRQYSEQDTLQKFFKCQCYFNNMIMRLLTSIAAVIALMTATSANAAYYDFAAQGNHIEAGYASFDSSDAAYSILPGDVDRLRISASASTDDARLWRVTL